MKSQAVKVVLVSTLVLSTVLVSSTSAAPLAAGGTTRQIPSAGTTSFAAASLAADTAVQDPEFASGAEGDAADAAASNDGHSGVNRSLSGATRGNGRSVNANGQAKSNPELNLSFAGAIMAPLQWTATASGLLLNISLRRARSLSTSRHHLAVAVARVPPWAIGQRASRRSRPRKNRDIE